MRDGADEAATGRLPRAACRTDELYPRNLRVSSFADVVVFDSGAEWNFVAAASRSKSKNTPFDGAPLLGKVVFTLSEGRAVFRLND